MNKGIYKNCLLFFLLITFNGFAQWKYPNANAIENDIVITYKVKYDQEHTEIQKKHPNYKNEIIIIFNKNKFLEKNISNNLDYQISSLLDYKKELAYSCTITRKSKTAIVSKFKEPIKEVTLQKGETKDILGFPCQVYTTNIKGEKVEILTTKKIGLRYIKQFNAQGFLLKYTSNDKYLGPYTVTATQIFYTKIPASTYSLKGFTIKTVKEHKQYLSERKEKSNKNRIKNIEKIGEKSPNFSARSIQGNKFKSKKLTDKIIVLNFWFTSCPPCVKEIPKLNQLKEEFKDKNVAFIAVALDQEYAIDKFLKKHPFEYDIVEDGRWIAENFEISLYPTNIIIDKNGIYQFVKTGYQSDITEAMSFKINKLLEE